MTKVSFGIKGYLNLDIPGVSNLRKQDDIESRVIVSASKNKKKFAREVTYSLYILEGLDRCFIVVIILTRM